MTSSIKISEMILFTGSTLPAGAYLPAILPDGGSPTGYENYIVSSSLVGGGSAASSSYALSASYAKNATSASYALSSSYAVTASYAAGAETDILLLWFLE